MRETSEQYVSRRLDEVAEKHFEIGLKGFADKEEYRHCLEECYALIARRECKVLQKEDSERFWMSVEEFDAQGWQGGFKCLQNRFCHISWEAFDELFATRHKGKKSWKIPYSRLLDALVEEKVIVRCGHYKRGKFPKSYLLHRDFVYDVVGYYVLTRNRDEDADVFKCFCARPSRRVLQIKMKKIREEYASLGEKHGRTVRLPDGWDDEGGIDEWGRFTFDSDGMTVDELARGLRGFKNQKRGHFKGGRWYDWFVRCPSSFRKYVYNGSRHYRELFDCHSGFMWMFSLYGVRMGQVSSEECRRMIDHCFSGTFYGDISEACKTSLVKTSFMRVLNMSELGLRCFCNVKAPHVSSVMKTVMKNLKQEYPEWYSFLEELKKNCAKKSEKCEDRDSYGRGVYLALSKIEKEVIDGVKNELANRGHAIRHLMRVHDALYGLEDVEGMEEMVRMVVDKIIYKSI